MKKVDAEHFISMGNGTCQRCGSALEIVDLSHGMKSRCEQEHYSITGAHYPARRIILQNPEEIVFVFCKNCGERYE